MASLICQRVDLMAVSKRLRHEVMRRDNFQCRYCRSTENALTIDHVVPVTLGGSDDPGNLVTACKDCNAGKSASSPDAPLIDDVAQDALRWSDAMKLAGEKLTAGLKVRTERQEQFLQVWQKWTAGEKCVPLPDGWRDSIDRFIEAGLPLGEVEAAVYTAMTRDRVAVESKFTYFCGICWSRITEMQEMARQILDDGGPEPEPQNRPTPDSEPPFDPDSGWSVSAERIKAWGNLVTEHPDLQAFAFSLLNTVADAARWLPPDTDPSSIWYGYGEFREQFGEGLKHRWVEKASELFLYPEEESDGYQYLVRMAYDYWDSLQAKRAEVAGGV